MLFLSFLTFTVVAVIAAPLEYRQANGELHALESRQADAIKAALMPVMDSLKSLDTAINGLNSDPQSALPILNASTMASQSLTEAGTKIQAADSLGLIGALGLQQTAGDLTTQVQTTIGDLTAKKAVLDQLGVTSVAVDALNKQKTASGGLSTALLSKVPAIAKPIAQQSTDKISQALDMGIQMLSAPAGSGTTAAGAATATGGATAAGASTAAASA
ncbi:hypothetical protein N0V82_000904 [Gnomoniopsis sp. IMI 355080]|nr:hypothetical protein N0V82_000904 [Gnomoniopsis sp. IMI 355080]